MCGLCVYMRVYVCFVYDLELISDAAENAQVIEFPDSDYVLLSEEDIEKEVNEGTA